MMAAIIVCRAIDATRETSSVESSCRRKIDTGILNLSRSVYEASLQLSGTQVRVIHTQLLAPFLSPTKLCHLPAARVSFFEKDGHLSLGCIVTNHFVCKGFMSRAACFF